MRYVDNLGIQSSYPCLARGAVLPGPIVPTLYEEQDSRVLSVLAVLQTVSLVAIALIAGPILCGWLVPAIGHQMPRGWDGMKANTAVMILLSGLSILFSQGHRSRRQVIASRWLGAMVFVIAALTFAEFCGLHGLSVDTLLAADRSAVVPGRPSAQTCFGFMLIGAALSSIRATGSKLSRLIDLCTWSLGLFFLSCVGSMVLGEGVNFGSSPRSQLSPQSFVCVGLITFVIFNRRTVYGGFSVLIDSGIGGKTARLAAPAAIVLPFLIEMMRSFIIRYRLLPYSYALAIVPSLMAILAFCLVLVLARRSGELEHAIREISLRDELTRLYNRRGFFALAEQTLVQAERVEEAFSVLFIDVDNLKRINDGLGHDVGSELLEEVAGLLRSVFRESDVVGRLGGDEFVVAMRADAAKAAVAVMRLEAAAAAVNKRSERKYEICFSVGQATRVHETETLEAMIERADTLMYQVKRHKKLHRQKTTA